MTLARDRAYHHKLVIGQRARPGTFAAKIWHQSATQNNRPDVQDMTTWNDAFAPIRIEPPERPLWGLRWLRTVVANPMEAWPAAIYREPFVVARSMGRNVVFVAAPELIREVLLNQAEVFQKGELSERTLKPVLGEAILTADGAHWRWQRRAAAPAFRPEHVFALVPSILAAADRRRAAWQALPEGAEINLSHEMMRTTFDVILDALLMGRDSLDAEGIEKAITGYLSSTGWMMAIALLRLPPWLPYPGARAARRARLHLRDVAAMAVRRVRENRSGAGRLMTLLAAATDPSTGRAMDDQDLADNFLTFMAAGHETTALALTWTFYLLSLHPAAEQRILAEIENVTGGEPVTAEHVPRLSFTGQVIQEAMRLYPPAPVIARVPRREITLAGQVIAPGTLTYIPTYAVHRHALLWDDPDRFDPERFAPHVAEARDRYAYLPFGAGPRTCIGMSFALAEAAAILATLLRSFHLRLRPAYRPRMKMQVTLRPAGGMPMRLSPR